MSRSEGIIYPPGEILNPVMGKTDFEYVILWMLTNNDVCEWSDFEAEISPSTLSGNLNKLLNKDYIEKPEKGKYVITTQGRDRFSELVYDRKLGTRRLKYPPKAITKYRNYDHWILWMLYNNYSCKWSDFKQEPLSINQSSLSNTLNSLLDDGFVTRENKEYIITPLGKTEYLRVLKSYDLDRQSILEQESKRIEEITEKTRLFFKKYKIQDDELKYRYLDNILKFSYSKVEAMLKDEEAFNKILLYISLNHPIHYPEFIASKEFSIKYKVDKTTLDYYIREIVDNEFFDIKFFHLKDEQGGIYYFQKNETIEKILNAIIEKHIIKFTYLNKFHETTTIDVGLLLDKIIDDVCTTLFDENLKPALKRFLPGYIKYLAYKIETEKKLVDSEAKLEGFVWQNIFEEFQTFEPANIPVAGEEDEFHYALNTDIFSVLNIMHLTKLYYANSREVQESYQLNNLETFKKIVKAFYKTKIDKAKQLFEDNYDKLKTINRLIIKDLIVSSERDYDESLNITEEIIKKYPEEFIGYLLKSNTYFLMDSYEKSLKIIDIGIKKAFNVALISHKAQILSRMYAVEKANQLIDKTLSEYPGNFLLIKTKFILFIHHWTALVKDNNVPLELIDQLLVLKPKDKDLLLLKGLYYCMVHKYKEVKQLITNEIDINTLKKSPRFDTEAYFILTFSYVARGKFEKALEIANLVLTLFPDHPISFLTKALVLGYNLIYRFTLKEPNIDTFLELIKLTVSFEPFSYDKTKYLLFQAHILNGLGKYDEAIESIENAMEMVPTLTSLIIMKIYYLIMSKREDEALILIDQYLESHPTLRRALYLHQSYIYVFQKKYEKGLEAANKALEIDPENTSILNNKAILLGYLGRKEEAIETSEKLITLSPNYGNSYDTYGEVLMALGEYENALEKLEKALTLEPTGWFAFATCLKMGDCYKELGKYEKALEYFVKGKKNVEKMHPSERGEHLKTAEKLIAEIKTFLGESKNSQ